MVSTVDRRVETAERLTRLEVRQGDIAQDLGEIKIAVLEIGKTMAKGATESTFQNAEILTEIKKINARHKSLRWRVTALSAAVAGLGTGVTHYAADILHYFFPSAGGK